MTKTSDSAAAATIGSSAKKLRRDASLLRSTSSVALCTASMILALGVCLPNSAQAACVAPDPSNNPTVIFCTGPSGTYGDGTQTGLSITVASGAVVAGPDSGIFISDGTVNVQGPVHNPLEDAIPTGRVAGGTAGILANSIVVNNAGFIEAAGDNGIAINVIAAAGAGATVTNSVTRNFGASITISANGAGGRAIFSASTITATNGAEGILGPIATIEATAADGIAILGNGNVSVTNFGNGVITGGLGAIASLGDVTIEGNDGRIEATGLGDATLSAGAAIRAMGTATIRSNGSAGIISGVGFGIDAQTVNVEANNGLISATGTNGIAINARDVDVTSNGSILAIGTGGTAIRAAANATVDITGGFVTGNAYGIFAGIDVTLEGNAGQISATGTNGTAIQAFGGNADITSNGSILATGTGGTAIHAGGDATVDITGGFVTGHAFGIKAMRAKLKPPARTALPSVQVARRT